MADKLTEIFSFRVPEQLKKMFDVLPADIKQKTYHDLRIELAKAVHENRFDPKLFGLSNEEES